MINSMTGYGRAQLEINGREISVETRTVNHRYFEFSCRIPRTYNYLEEKLKALFHQKIQRGKIEVYVTLSSAEQDLTQVEINTHLAHSYLDAIKNLGKDLSLADDVGLSDLIRFNDIFNVKRIEEDEDEVWECVEKAASLALEKLMEMRKIEGESLHQDIVSRLDIIKAHVDEIEKIFHKIVEDYRTKLYAKICEVLENKQVDEQRILTEAAIYAEKIAITEEIVRLNSHIAQFRDTLKQDYPVGRKLDFLIQEFNREANTIGSKIQDADVLRLVVEVKSEIEKIKEQIQNVE